MVQFINIPAKWGYIQLTYLQAQESHDPSRAWFELLDVLPYIEQETISIEALSTCPSTTLPSQSPTAETWRQLSAFMPITPLLSDQKLRCCHRLPRTGAAGSSFAQVSDPLRIHVPYSGPR